MFTEGHVHLQAKCSAGAVRATPKNGASACTTLIAARHALSTYLVFASNDSSYVVGTELFVDGGMAEL